MYDPNVEICPQTRVMLLPLGLYIALTPSCNVIRLRTASAPLPEGIPYQPSRTWCLDIPMYTAHTDPDPVRWVT